MQAPCLASFQSGIFLKTVCGQYPSPLRILSPFHSSHIWFKSDSSGTDKGFNFTYSSSPCGGVLNGPSHVINSPVDPSQPSSSSKYPANVDCAWLLDFEDGQQIEVNLKLIIV